jgi:hypothetical protein
MGFLAIGIAQIVVGWLLTRGRARPATRTWPRGGT